MYHGAVCEESALHLHMCSQGPHMCDEEHECRGCWGRGMGGEGEGRGEGRGNEAKINCHMPFTYSVAFTLSLTQAYPSNSYSYDCKA